MSADMSKVQVGTRVRLRNGVETKITTAHAQQGLPFCTGVGIWHKEDGACCVVSGVGRDYDIVEILNDDDPVASPAPTPERTLLDEFAMAALQGDWAAQNEASGCFSNQVSSEVLQERATVYYRMASAMMKARNAK